MVSLGALVEPLEVHTDMPEAMAAAEGGPVNMGSLERHDFCAAARRAHAVVAMAEARP
jgi:L-fucose mutarotase/ribose pyranase (RbsD/FucU family)